MAFTVVGRLFAFPLMLLTPPLLSALMQGAPLKAFIKFPPFPVTVVTSKFSWPIFFGIAVISLCALFPFVRGLARDGRAAQTRKRLRPLPWWGYVGMGITALAWFLAWTRFPCLEPLQAYTFTPLWLGYILAVNALCHRRTGRCLLLDSPLFFLSLFPLSAYFWWLFEYLNQFAGNWHYVDVPRIRPLERFVVSSASFSTVLPAVLSTTQWLASFDRAQSALTGFKPLGERAIRGLTTAGLFISLAGLGLLGTHPQYAFPALWIAPLFIALTLGSGKRDVLPALRQGDWRPIVLPALAALICGFFWEMWNFGSLARWEYAVPFVQRFHLFNMPLLGYAGYLPFGAVCYLFTRLFDDKARLSSVLQPMKVIGHQQE